MNIGSIGHNTEKVAFNSRREHPYVIDKRAMATAFVNMNDQQLQKIAYVSAHKEASQKQRPYLTSTLLALPVVGALTDTILTKEKMVADKVANLKVKPTQELVNKIANGTVVKLSDRLSAGVKTGAKWGFALVILGIYDSIRDAVVSKTPSLKRFRENHPIPAFLTDLAAFLGVALLGFKGAHKVGQKMFKETPEVIKGLDNVVESVKKGIDKSPLNEKVLPAVEEGITKLSSKSERLGNLAESAVRNSVWLVVLGSLLKGPTRPTVERKDVDRNMYNLKQAQLKTAKHLLKVTEIERNVLSRNQRMTDDLKDEFDKTLG